MTSQSVLLRLILKESYILESCWEERIVSLVRDDGM